MNYRELSEELKDSDIDKRRHLRGKYGLGDSTDPQAMVRRFVEKRDGPEGAALERRLAQEFGLLTEQEKLTQASIEAADAAKASAEQASDALKETRSYRKATWVLVAVAVISALIAVASLVVQLADR